MKMNPGDIFFVNHDEGLYVWTDQNSHMFKIPRGSTLLMVSCIREMSISGWEPTLLCNGKLLRTTEGHLRLRTES